MCFFFNDTATTEIYTLSLHDALPISARIRTSEPRATEVECANSTTEPPGRPPSSSTLYEGRLPQHGLISGDRKSTRLNSSHANISYAVFCLKKKNNIHYYLYCSSPTP